MDSSELVSWLRTDAFIGDASAYPDQTDAVLRSELTHKLHSVFEDIVTKARSGYWLKEYITTTTSGRGRYRIPPRAVVGGLEKIEVAAAAGGVYYPLDEISPNDVQNWEGAINGGNPGPPLVFVSMGDQLELFPTPNAALPLRMSYYVRPSQLVEPQSGNNFVVRGRITAFNPVARTVTVNVIPFDQLAPAPGTMANGALVDVVHPDGWHELAMVNAPSTFTGTTITLGGADDMSDIAIGDYVRVADQTDWPCLPDDFHRCLADVAAIKVAVELGLREKNDELAQNVENDLVRFRSLLVPRVKSQPKTTPISLMSRGRCW